MPYSDADLSALVRTCIGRRNDYAVQRADGLYFRAGRPLSREVLQRHLAGVETIGTYLIDEQGCCRFAVFDADEVGILTLLSVQRQLAGDGILSYLEASRRGGHLWVFLLDAAPAARVRSWLLPFCPVGVEFYPKQDGGSREHPGSLLRVPFGVHRRSGRRYPFVAMGTDGRLVPLVSSVGDGLHWLSTVERTTVPTAPVVSSVPQHDDARPPDQQKKCPAKTVLGSTVGASTLTIRDWCADQHPLTVIGRYVQLDSRGVGCCPFGWHHANGRDSHPSFKVYTPKIAGGYCWYCSAWERGGSVFDFLLLYHHLETRALWHRILSGEQF